MRMRSVYWLAGLMEKEMPAALPAISGCTETAPVPCCALTRKPAAQESCVVRPKKRPAMTPVLPGDSVRPEASSMSVPPISTGSIQERTAPPSIPLPPFMARPCAPMARYCEAAGTDQ